MNLSRLILCLLLAPCSVLLGQNTSTGRLTVQKNTLFTGIISPTLLADQNNYSPAGLQDATVLRLNASTGVAITGLDPGLTPGGRVLLTYPTGAGSITFINESALSVASNRFSLGADLTLQPGAVGIFLQYDAASSRWRAAGGGGGGGSTARFGSGAPSAGLGSNGDTYTRLDSPYGIYLKAAGAWGSPQITFALGTHTHAQADVTNLTSDLAAKVPTSRTINGFDLSADRTLTTASIADASNKRYVTDAQLTIISQTSGTNTGDQNLSGYATLAGINAWLAANTFLNTGLGIFDTDASHRLFVVPGSNLTADRTFTVITGDASRSLTLSGNVNFQNSFTVAGGFTTTLNVGATTNVTLPSSGTLLANSRSISTTPPLSGGGDFTADRTFSIANAAADGTTKGAASFVANDFDASSGNISLDYSNGQAASGSLKGFLTTADWTAFNNKVPAARSLAGLDLSADRTAAALTTALNAMVGDAGSGGTKGLVPAPAAGDAAKFLNGAGLWSTPAGSGDVSSNTATSVDSELALFNGTTGKSIKRATGSGIPKLTSGVLSIATAATDYVAPSAYASANGHTMATARLLGRTTASTGAAEEISVSSPLSLTALALSITNAAADGSTKGAASFSANDFDASSGNVSLDYANAQAATSGQKGFLIAADWSTFNGKFGSTTKTDVLQAGAFAADAGANDTYTATYSPAITSYVTGTEYRFKANTANTGPASLNINAVGAVTIKKVAGGITTDLADNDIRAGQWVHLVYDGTNFQMQSLLGNAPAGGGGVSDGDKGDVVVSGSGTVYTVDHVTGSAEATVASGATTNIGAATSNLVNVTGTTTITAFDTASSGLVRTVRFSGALTLTHNGTSLILPGAANIVTGAGDIAVFSSAGSGNWRLLNYQRAVIPPGSVVTLDFGYSTAPSGATGGSGSWSYVIPAGAKTIKFPVVIGAGGGGGAGGRGPSGSVIRGGGGGGPGIKLVGAQEISVSDLPSNTLTITVGLGGAGAIAQASDSTAGANGSNGGDTTVVCGSYTFFLAKAGTAGAGGGTGTGGAAGTAGAVASSRSLYGVIHVSSGSAAGGTAGAGGAPGDTLLTGANNTTYTFLYGGPLPGSGGGGAVPVTPSNQAGGIGGRVLNDTSGASTLLSGGAAAAGAAGQPSNVILGYIISGASGGSSNASGAGFAGGAGQKGAGGGGGGGSLNGNASGAGAAGGDGFVRIVLSF